MRLICAAVYSLTRGRHSASNSRMVLVSISPASRNPRAVLCTVSRIVLRFAIVVHLNQLTDLDGLCQILRAVTQQFLSQQPQRLKLIALDIGPLVLGETIHEKHGMPDSVRNECPRATAFAPPPGGRAPPFLPTYP